MSEPQTRYHGLDALRAFAMLLGLVLHGALVLVEPEIFSYMRPGAPVPDPETGVLAIYVWIHLWRIPLFFILAGFFAQMMLDRQGPWSFGLDRFNRILLTCVIFVALHNAVAQEPFGILSHLWFLWVLWWCCALASGLRALGISGHIRWISMVFATPKAMLWLILPLTLMSLALRDDLIIQRIPESFAHLEWRGALFFLLFFFAGQALWERRALLQQLAQPRVYWSLLAAGFAAMTVFLIFAETVGDSLSDLPQGWRVPVALAGAPFAGIATGAFSFGLIGLTQHLVTRSTWTARSLVRLAYPVYVLHLFIVMELTAELHLIFPQWGQLAVIGLASLGTFGLCALLYLIFIRFTPLDWLFAGRKKAWWQWPRLGGAS